MNKQTQFACIIRQARMQKKLKSAYVAHRCNISPSYYSQIERGNKLPSKEIQNTILSVLEIHNFEAELDKQIDEIIQELLNNIYFADSMRIHASYFKLKNRLPDSYLKFHLAQLAYFVTFKKIEEAKEELAYLSSYTDHLNDEEINLYNLYYAITLREQDKLKESLNILENIHSSDEHLSALISYHLAIIYSKLNNPLLAHDFNNKAIELFRKSNNLTRLTYSISHDAILYAQQQLYDIANEKYLQLLQIRHNLSRADKRIILINATTNALNAKDYKSARKFLNRIRCLPDEEYYDLYTCIKCRYYFEINQHSLLKKHIQNLNLNDFNPHFKCLIKVFYSLSTKDRDLIQKTFHKVEKSLKNADHDILKYFYELGIQYSNSYKKELYYYEQLLAIKERRN